ncbi:nucleotide disphospho-sugar-binding domain-containing protein [Streptomyces cyaneofuscatus]|uniref:nucleotide disphospho-sugar-binding domain-containing protein n=1 Tax=Streptomyces cyaneofuscatus TaxID=66883 RepID=UPI003664A898
MRVLFTFFPYASHLYPLVPLARALREAGHEVAVASATEEQQTIVGAGLRPVDLGSKAQWRDTPRWADSPLWRRQEERLREITALLSLPEPDATHWSFVRRQFLPVQAYYFTPDRREGGPPMVQALVEFARSWRPDLVVWDFTVPTAAVAAHACGAAHARFTWGLDYLGWAAEQFVSWRRELGPGLGQDPQVALATAAAARFGLAYTRDMVLGQWTIEATAADIQLPLQTGRLKVRHVPYSNDGPVPEGVTGPRRRPRVCLSVDADDGAGEPLFAGSALFDVVAALGRGPDMEVVVPLAPERLGGEAALPRHVRALSYVPFDRLLPTCSALVHYGGVGSFAAAVAHGVPQVIVPRDLGNGDALLEHLRASGAGTGVSEAHCTPELLRTLVGQVLEDPSFRAGAGRLREAMAAAPAPHAIVPALEELTRRHRPPAPAPL